MHSIRHVASHEALRGLLMGQPGHEAYHGVPHDTLRRVPHHTYVPWDDQFIGF